MVLCARPSELYNILYNIIDNDFSVSAHFLDSSGIFHKNTIIEMMESNCSYVKNNGHDDTTVLTNQHLTQHLDLAQFTDLTTQRLAEFGNLVLFCLWILNMLGNIMAENLGTETMLISQNQFLFFFLVQSFVLVLVLHCSSAIKTFYISFPTAVTV